MTELIKYLVDNLYLDFQGEISLETVRGFLQEDDGKDARQLLAKLLEDKSVDDMLLTLADCLKDHITSGVSAKVVKEQLMLYAESWSTRPTTRPGGSSFAAAASFAALATLLGAGPVACDAGEPEFQPIDAPPVHVLEVRVSAVDDAGGVSRAAIAGDGSTRVTTATSFEVRVDRFLLPTSATRQALCLASTTTPIRSLEQCISGVLLEPTYDPVLRRVTYRQRSGARLAPDTLYQLAFYAPTEEAPYGFVAFDGAPFAAPMQLQFRTAVQDPPDTSDEVPLGGDLFCCGDTANPCPLDGFGAATTFSGCAFSPCHATSGDGSLGPSMGLNLSPPPANAAQQFEDPILATAVNHVAHQTQTGEVADEPAQASETSRFGRAMALIRPSEPGNSYLLYKLAAEPANYPEGEAPSAAELARLRAALVVGMPMPAYGGTPLEGRSLELLSAWIAAGAQTGPCTP